MTFEDWGYVAAFAANVALFIANMRFASKNAENARENLRRFIRLTTNCPNCLHYEALCDVHAKDGTA